MEKARKWTILQHLYNLPERPYLEALQGVGCQKTGVRGHVHKVLVIQVECRGHQCACRARKKKERKDRKRLRQQRHTNAKASLHCNYPGCFFVAVKKTRSDKLSMQETHTFWCVCLLCTIV